MAHTHTTAWLLKDNSQRIFQCIIRIFYFSSSDTQNTRILLLDLTCDHTMTQTIRRWLGDVVVRTLDLRLLRRWFESRS